jgi:putative redox protein
MPAVVDVTYAGDLRCTARSIALGHMIETDVPQGQGGLGEAMSPTDLVAAAVGTCVLTTMAMVAERRQIDLRGLAARMEKEMAAKPVHRIASISMTIDFPPDIELTAADRERLESAANRCPVKQSLHGDVVVDIRFVYPQGPFIAGRKGAEGS